LVLKVSFIYSCYYWF